MQADQPSTIIDKLMQLSSTINSSLDIVEVLKNAIFSVEELVNAEVCSIFEVDESKNELFFRAVRDQDVSKVEKIRMKMGEGIVGWVASSGEPVIVTDTEKDKRFSPQVDSKTGFKTKSIIALPIKNKGQLIGVVEVLNKRGGGSFNHEDLNLLTIVVNQISIAIVNAKLFERLREKFSLTQSELKRAQEKLLRSERMAALGQLSQGVAHEVRNPVMSIGGFARRLKKEFDPDNKAVAYVDIILKEAGRLEKMVKDIEHYISMPEPVFQPVRVLELLQTAADIWKGRDQPQNKNILIKLKKSLEEPTVVADKDQLTQAIVSLLDNSAEAMQNGGTIFISTCWEENCLAISVKDDGCGIGPEDLPCIFDPFFTAKSQGSGLGLTKVNRIVSEHGGEVRVSSNLGFGTEVKLLIPRSYESGILSQ